MIETTDTLAAFEAADQARNDAEAALRAERVTLTARIEKIDELLPPVAKAKRARKVQPGLPKAPRKPRQALGAKTEAA